MLKDKLFRWALCALLILTGWYVSGCAPASTDAATSYRLLEVPVPCDARKPEKPLKDDDTLIALINALAYAEELEIVLDLCLRHD
jgi:hypothetical protein